MFKTFMGPVEETASVVYLRPETAQGIFLLVDPSADEPTLLLARLNERGISGR